MISAFGIEHGEISKVSAGKAFGAGFRRATERPWKPGAAKVKNRAYKAGHWVGRNPTAIGATGGAVVGGSVGFGIDEGVRHARQKRAGIKVSRKEYYLHPYQTNAKLTNARMKRQGKSS